MKSEILISSSIAVKTCDSKFYYVKQVKIKKILRWLNQYKLSW